MKERDFHSATVTRRGFGAAVAAGAVAAVTLPRAAGATTLAAGWTGGPVVGFHADAPWVDRTGRDTPYLPPRANGAFAADSAALACLGHFL